MYEKKIQPYLGAHDDYHALFISGGKMLLVLCTALWFSSFIKIEESIALLASLTCTAECPVVLGKGVSSGSSVKIVRGLVSNDVSITVFHLLEPLISFL